MAMNVANTMRIDMVAVNKKNKQVRAYLHKTGLKNKDSRLKRLLFYTSSQRQIDKARIKQEKESL